MGNFKCPTCEKEHSHGTYTLRGDGFFYNKWKEKLVCDCKEKSPLISTKEWDGGVPAFGKFASASQEDKAKILKKRSTEHFNKEVKERRNELNSRRNLDTD